MKLPIVLFAAAAVWAQPPLKSVSPAGAADKGPLSFAVIADLEKQLDDKVSTVGGATPMMLLGTARTLYLPGYGAVVTQEISLTVTPAITPFHQSISPQEVVRVHQQKIERLPLMRQTMKDMWTHTASTLNMIPNNEQIVVAVRLLYKSWEDTKGLPGQIILKGSRSAGIGGAQMDEQ